MVVVGLEGLGEEGWGRGGLAVQQGFEVGEEICCGGVFDVQGFGLEAGLSIAVGFWGFCYYGMWEGLVAECYLALFFYR